MPNKVFMPNKVTASRQYQEWIDQRSLCTLIVNYADAWKYATGIGLTIFNGQTI